MEEQKSKAQYETMWLCMERVVLSGGSYSAGCVVRQHLHFLGLVLTAPFTCEQSEHETLNWALSCHGRHSLLMYRAVSSLSCCQS